MLAHLNPRVVKCARVLQAGDYTAACVIRDREKVHADFIETTNAQPSNPEATRSRKSASCAARNTQNKPLTKFGVACIPMLDSLMQQCVGIHAAGDIRLANAETNKLEILHSRINAKLLLKHSKLPSV